MHRMAGLCALVLISLIPSTAAAQTTAFDGSLSVAPYVGAVLDTSDDWFLIGGEARLKLEGRSLEVNPRLTFNPFEGGSMMQIDLNLLHNLELATESRFRPFAGIGGAFNRVSFDDFSDNSVGLNLISGARLTMSPESRFEPFANAQYTIIKGQANPFTIVIGATFQVR